MGHTQVNTRGPETDFTQALKITEVVIIKKPSSVIWEV